jgi:hypothetical protein
MKLFARPLLAIALLVGASSLCCAEVLKQEPPPGTLPAGQKVLVDDGTCGPGKIKEVTGGNNNRMNPMVRTSRCIAKRK